MKIRAQAIIRVTSGEIVNPFMVSRHIIAHEMSSVACVHIM